MRIPKHLLDNPDKLAKDLTDESWESFIPDNREIAPTEKLRSHIEQNIGTMHAPVKSIRRTMWIAAASVTLLAGIGICLLPGKNPEAQKPAVASAPSPAIPAPHERKSIANRSQKVKTIFLADGSKVELTAASSLSFNQPFINGRRDIYLAGAAVFNVKKDNAHPFIVHAKGISTTVLGTVFSISDKQTRFTTVRLYSGKVVVKKDNDRSFKDVYLSPGQQLVINKETFSVQIKQPASVVTKKDSTLSTPLQVMDFDNRPLEEIFTLLQKTYNTTISFDPASVRKMSFTGKLNRSRESLESFLHTLCDLNELSLKTKGDKGFIIEGK